MIRFEEFRPAVKSVRLKYRVPVRTQEFVPQLLACVSLDARVKEENNRGLLVNLGTAPIISAQLPARFMEYGVFLKEICAPNVSLSSASKVIVKVFPAFALALSLTLLAQAPGFTRPERQAQGQVLASSHDPAVQITFASQFKYVGGQTFLLYGVAEAEQHFYVQTSADGKVQRFYWIQFEHYLPDNNHQYDYPSKRKMDLGGLSFIHDSAVFADYAGANKNPDSDGGKARTLLKKSGLAFPSAMARIRMVHLTDASRRKELMIIYGEALEEKAPPNAEEGLEADDKFPELALSLRSTQKRA